MACSESDFDKLQRGYPYRAELPDVNIKTGAQSINSDRASLKKETSTVQPRGRAVQCELTDTAHESDGSTVWVIMEMYCPTASQLECWKVNNIQQT